MYQWFFYVYRNALTYLSEKISAIAILSQYEVGLCKQKEEEMKEPHTQNKNGRREESQNGNTERSMKKV